MFFQTLFLLTTVFGCQAYWQMDWSDEFHSGHSIDSNDWDVINEDISCDGNYIQQLNCKTNSSRNLWLFDGTLSIAAVQLKEKYLEHDYTSAMIITKKAFTFGRFEIRAALPKGKMLRPAIYFIPTKNTGLWPKDGQIDVMTNIQRQNLGNGIHIVRNYNQYEGKEYTAKAKLNHFHSYVLEWNQSMIIWKFDETQHLTINLTEKLENFYNPFTSPFKLVITLGVGGQFFAGVLTEEDARKWDCSLLVLDYVRHYQWIEGSEKSSNKTEDRTSSSNICDKIMPLIRLSKELDIQPNSMTNSTTNSTTNSKGNSDEKENNIPFTTIISVFSFILLLILFLFVIYLFKRQEKLRLNTRVNEKELYDDCPESGEGYYECVKDEENEYADPYQTESSHNSNDYTEKFIDNSPKRKAEDYIEITNTYM